MRMRMTIEVEEVALYQEEAESIMDFLEYTYNEYVDTLTSEEGLWTKFKNSFHYPPSLRMYNMYEVLLEGDELTQAKKYRRIWHDYWAIANQFGDMRGCANQTVTLDEYETEIILRLRKFK